MTDVVLCTNISNSERLSNAEIKEAHWSVVQHCDEAEQYFQSHLERQDGNEVIHKRDFPNYFPIWVPFYQSLYMMLHKFNIYVVF